MVDIISKVNDFINNIVWGVPMIIFILGTGIYLTIRLGFVQITKIKDIIVIIFSFFLCFIEIVFSFLI